MILLVVPDPLSKEVRAGTALFLCLSYNTYSVNLQKHLPLSQVFFVAG